MIRPIIMISVVFFTLFSASTKEICAQPDKGTVGIAAMVQHAQLDFRIPMWVGDKVVWAPSFGIISASDLATDLSLGFSLHTYLKKEKLSPFIGGRLAMFILFPDVGLSRIDFGAGVYFGAEYFFDKNFSVASELQLNAAFSDKLSPRFGLQGGTTINTATSIVFSFYF